MPAYHQPLLDHPHHLHHLCRMSEPLHSPILPHLLFLLSLVACLAQPPSQQPSLQHPPTAPQLPHRPLQHSLTVPTTQALPLISVSDHHLQTELLPECPDLLLAEAEVKAGQGLVLHQQQQGNQVAGAVGAQAHASLHQSGAQLHQHPRGRGGGLGMEQVLQQQGGQLGAALASEHLHTFMAMPQHFRHQHPHVALPRPHMPDRGRDQHPELPGGHAPAALRPHILQHVPAQPLMHLPAPLGHSQQLQQSVAQYRSAVTVQIGYAQIGGFALLPG